MMTSEATRRRQAWRAEQWKRDPRCDYCDKVLRRKEATVDHIKPVSAGGLDDPTNYAIACEACNARKGNLNYHVHKMLLRRKRRSDSPVWQAKQKAKKMQKAIRKKVVRAMRRDEMEMQ